MRRAFHGQCCESPPSALARTGLTDPSTLRCVANRIREVRWSPSRRTVKMMTITIWLACDSRLRGVFRPTHVPNKRMDEVTRAAKPPFSRLPPAITARASEPGVGCPARPRAWPVPSPGPGSVVDTRVGRPGASVLGAPERTDCVDLPAIQCGYRAAHHPAAPSGRFSSSPCRPG